MSELQAVGVSLQPQRSEEDLKWDCHLTELLAFRREAGSCRLPPEGWATAPELGPWLAEVQVMPCTEVNHMLHGSDGHTFRSPMC